MADFAGLAARDVDDRAFAHELVRARRVAAIPPSAFYASAPPRTLLRFAFCKRKETLLAARARLLDA
jgi:aspartate/methionine/tyrosine aminotransferase